MPAWWIFIKLLPLLHETEISRLVFSDQKIKISIELELNDSHSASASGLSPLESRYRLAFRAHHEPLKFRTAMPLMSVTCR